jgi:tetratricopeptide (TPR) repeat protein
MDTDMNRLLTRCAAVVCVLALSASVSGIAACRAGDAPESELAKRLDTQSPEDQLSLLRGLVAEGKYDADVYFYIGNSYFSLEHFDSAVVAYGQAIGQDSSYVKAWVNMGLAYDGQKQGQASRRAFEEALKVDPADVLALCHLGFSYFSKGDTDEAIRQYLKALEIDPNSAQGHYNLGLAFADTKVFREALVEWKMVVKLDPDGELGKAAAENVELIQTYMELEDN